MTEIIGLLKDRMNQEGLTAYALEKRAGLKSSAIHNILSGRSKNPSFSIIKAIAKALNCTVSDLIGDEPITSSILHTGNAKITAVEPESFKNNELYIKCLSHVSALLNKQNLWIDKKLVLDCVEEVYLYSLKKGLNKADIHFAQWLIEKNTG